MKHEILVIGESCKDIFIYCDANRLCPDIPVPILTKINEIQNPGMAKNVQRNILTKIKNCDIITNENWENITKTRFVHNETNHMFFRMDTSDIIERININKINFNYKIIVISDYNKGFLKEDDIKYICNNHPNVFVDTKKQLGSWINNAILIKINNFEYLKSMKRINNIIKSKIIRTMGSDGCQYNNKIYPVKKVQIKDTSGAGDSFMAALIIKYLKTNDINKSIIYANKCASFVVKERGVTTI